jgi:hypothetical protein
MCHQVSTLCVRNKLYPLVVTHLSFVHINRFYAPYCKACKAFGVKFRKLAIDRGDRLNAMGNVILVGDSRFGEIEMSRNVILCKKLQIKKFPTVLIYKGGERLSEVLCKQAAIDDINKEMDQLLGNV